MSHFLYELYVDEPATSPSFRTVARKSKQMLVSVMAVYFCLYSEQRSEPGMADFEKIASMTDLLTEQVKAIMDAMDCLLLDKKS